MSQPTDTVSECFRVFLLPVMPATGDCPNDCALLSCSEPHDLPAPPAAHAHAPPPRHLGRCLNTTFHASLPRHILEPVRQRHGRVRIPLPWDRGRLRYRVPRCAESSRDRREPLQLRQVERLES